MEEELDTVLKKKLKKENLQASRKYQEYRRLGNVVYKQNTKEK